jgi:hypothetical protein
MYVHVWHVRVHIQVTYTRCVHEYCKIYECTYVRRT